MCGVPAARARAHSDGGPIRSIYTPSFLPSAPASAFSAKSSPWGSGDSCLHPLPLLPSSGKAALAEEGLSPSSPGRPVPATEVGGQVPWAYSSAAIMKGAWVLS